MYDWVLLHYKIPSKPTSSRVYVWRKLKTLGAILLQDAVWVLPKTPWTTEQFQWLLSEIQELGGEAMLWESHLLMGNAEGIGAEFRSKADLEYQELLNEFSQTDCNVSTLSRRYHQIRTRDYFDSEVGESVYKRLEAIREGHK
ncbi:MAG: Chromate resistance protein ChrB [Tumebacillaceae bacterium]